MTTVSVGVDQRLTSSSPSLDVSVILRAVLIIVGVTAGVAIIAGLINFQPVPVVVIVGAVLGAFFGGVLLRPLGKRNAGLVALIATPLGILVGVLLGALVLQLLGASLLAGAGDAFLKPYESRVSLIGRIATELPLLLIIGGAAYGVFAAVAGAPHLFLTFPLSLYFIWIIGPTIATGYIAMTNWDGIGTLDKARFVGFDNFVWLFENDNFWTAFWNNVRWLAFFIVIPTSMGLGLAMVFNGDFPGARLFKIAFYSPLVLAPTVVALMWENIYRPDSGLLDAFLHLFGQTESPGWLANTNLVLWCIIIAAAWRQVGYVMILYLAGLKGLDTTLIEASTVDGANGWERFRFVIFPLLAPVTVVVIVISVIDSLRAFDLVAIMTRGGPNFSSEVMANFMYLRAFNDYRMGYAGASAVVLLAIMLVFIIPYLIHQSRTELEY
jgi:multiple sugar transport system permease protein